MSDTVIRSRIDFSVKEEATRVLQSMGLTMSEAIRLFLHQVIAEKAIPFPVKVPNTVTASAMESVQHKIGLESVTIDQLVREWEE